jgi:cytochrome c-type biogenesis protein CcmH
MARLTGEAPAGDTLSGPSQEEVAAAGEMTAEDRQAMISNMVAGLAERLSTEGGSAEEWNRLIRAYMVLGKKQDAEQALAAALSAYADKPEDLSMIKDAASKLGLSDG